MDTKVWASDYSFFLPFTRCPPKPLPQVCACSIVTRILNLRSINDTTGAAIPLTERPLLGDVNIAAMPLATEKCVHQLSVASYPFRILSVMDMGVTADSEAMKAVGKTPMERLLYGAVTKLNNADPEPIRPWRLITQTFPIGTLPSQANAEMKNLMEMYKPFMLIGTILPVTTTDFLSVLTNTQPFVSDLPLTTRADGWKEHIVDFMPSEADLVHALVSYYSDNRAQFGSYFAIAATEEEAALITKSFHTFQLEAPSVTISALDSVWASQLASWSTAGSPFVLAVAGSNISLGRVATVSAASNEHLTVGLALFEPSMEELIDRMNNASLPSTSDIVFASPFSAHWLPGNTMNDLMTSIGVNTSDAPYNYTYLSAAMGLAIQLANQAINFKDAAELLYTARTASVADVSLGPFYNDTCSDEIVLANLVDRDCQCKKAFRQLRVHSLYNRLEGEDSARTSNYLFRMTTCGVSYMPLVIQPDDESWKTILIVALVCGVALLSIVSGLVIYLCCCGRNNSYAPKDSTKAFAIAFTDIQASTTLWSRAPAIMSEAVEHHCVIIRKLIRQFKGYEVKTIGDSFMVAFESLENSVAFSVRLQEAFHKDKWPAEIDQHYKEILEQAVIEAKMDGKDKVEIIVNAPADDTEYLALWHGIRVRVGLNYGFGEVRKDSVTLGYDYFGTLVNTAARVEGVGHGGQTLVTEAVLIELPKPFLNSLKVAQMSLGPQYLRGLDEKTVLIQLLPTSLAGRRFPNLRLDVENQIETSESGTNGTATSLDTNLTVEQLATKLVNEVVNKGKKQQDTLESDKLMSVADDPMQSKTSFITNNNTNKAVRPTRDSAAVNELLAYYNFIEALMSTSTEVWRKDALKQMAKRWHVPANHLGTTTSDPQRVKVVMSLAVKGMMMVRMQNKKRRQGSKASLFEGVTGSIETGSQSPLQSRAEPNAVAASTGDKLMTASTSASLFTVNAERSVGPLYNPSFVVPANFSQSVNRVSNNNNNAYYSNNASMPGGTMSNTEEQ